jgi:SAM-dependent methyltransferase
MVKSGDGTDPLARDLVDLPRVPVYRDRRSYVIERCRGRRVLHLGCADSGLLAQRLAEGRLLHHDILGVSEQAWGLDVDAAALATLAGVGVDGLIVADVTDQAWTEAVSNLPFDLVVAGELLEHLDNPGLFLSSVRGLLISHDAAMVLTVPNAFSFQALVHLWRDREFVHPDHNYWFSYRTILRLLAKHGLRAEQVAVYAFTPRFGDPVDGERRREHDGMSLRGRIWSGAIQRVASMLARRSRFWSDGIMLVARPI